MLLPLRMIAATLASAIALANAAGQASAQSADTGPLFVAELGNDSVGIVDLPNRKLISRIPGLNEPQGVAYEHTSDMLYVANAGDGSVRSFEGSDYKTTGRIELGNDADNIRVDAAAKRIFVGYGSGALAVIDPSTRSKVGDISLEACPMPGASRSSTAFRKSRSEHGRWPIGVQIFRWPWTTFVARSS